MLMVVQDTRHADELQNIIKGDGFFEGRYKNRVMTVHSNQRGDEKDEVIERLLQVEDTKEPAEIVIHVNKLKEDWDVTNLNTIVPLRAAKAEILVHQTIGRGLRLPYGKRTGVPAVDRLTIVAHDKFQAIIDEANNPDSIIRTGVVIGRDVSPERRQVFEVKPTFQTRVAPAEPGATQGELVFQTEAEQKMATATLDVIRKYERLPSSSDLRSPEVQAEIVREVKAIYAPVQGRLVEVAEQPDVDDIVKKTVDVFIENSIDIPRIIVVPKGDVTSGFNDFNLETSGIRPQPVARDILIYLLQSNQRMSLISGTGVMAEKRDEDYLVRALMDYDDISYDSHAGLLYKLARQMVQHLQSYLADDEEVLNVLQYHQRLLGEFIHAQMQSHYWKRAAGYEAHVSKGFVTLRPNSFAALAGENMRPFRAPVEEQLYIKGMLFGGFGRCLYPVQKFDNDTERRFAILLEDDKEVRKWFKPARGQFQIEYQNGHLYEPDFVVETDTAKLICETKRASDMGDAELQAKARAAVHWCEYATSHELEHGGKPWKYLLIPHDAVTASTTLGGLASVYAVQAHGAQYR